MTIPQVPSIAGLQTKLSRAQGHRDSLLYRLQEVRKEIIELKEEMSLLDHVETLFRGFIDAEIADAVEVVEGLQTEALRAVFTDLDLSVRADVSTERGKIAVSLVTLQKEEDGSVTEGESTDSFGGSVTTVESMLLRFLVMIRRNLRPFLLLDESLPAFDPNYAHNMGQFLTALCERMGVDMLMVTHNPMFYESAHRTYRVRRHSEGVQFDLVHEVPR